jgi:hypothetical protein
MRPIRRPGEINLSGTQKVNSRGINPAFLDVKRPLNGFEIGRNWWLRAESAFGLDHEMMTF